MRSLAFGLDRVVDPIFRWPRVSAAVVLCILAVAAFGATQLTFDQNLRGTFAGDRSTYADYARTVEEFIDPENEILILVEGDDLGEPTTFAKLRDFQFELQFVDGVASVTSAFALRKTPDENGDAALVISDVDAGLTPTLSEEIRAHPFYGNKLLSNDGTAMIFVLTPAEEKAPLSTTRQMRIDITDIVDSLFADTGLTTTVSGFPTLRLDIVDVLIRDQIALNIAGVIVGVVMSLIVFRSLIAAIITAVPAVMAGGTVIGMIGLIGTPMTVMSNVVPALIMVLGYADGMHLTHAWRRRRTEGAGAVEAELNAQREVGPACMLTAITTALAFLSLTLSDVEIVSTFAMIGAAGAIAGGMMVLSVHTLLAMSIGRFWKPSASRGPSPIARLREPSARVGRFAVDHANRIAVAAVLLFATLAAMHFSVPPQHSIREHLPANNPTNAALGRIDKLFDGAFPIQIVVPLAAMEPTSPEALEKIRLVHEAVDAVQGADRPLSLWSVAQWLGGDTDQASARLTELTDGLSENAASRFVGNSGSLITTSIHEMTTQEAEPLIGEIERAARQAGGPDVVVTGVTVLTAVESNRTINNLFWSLTLAIVAGICAISLAFRNWRVGVVAALPNAMPIFATGALLFILDRGMQFTSVLSLTVAYGIAVDDTIHYLNRFRITAAVTDLRERLIDTSRHIGPVLVGTTAIIIAGLSTTLVSEMPTIILFGQLAGVTLAAALVADLLVLPALMAGVARSWFETKPKPVETARQDEPVSA
ncbi:efflux RND transporter permease subunit [Bauldia sp.]|uniref:efflux RND transporter permease subunit n=1 Tax=Bauldia sp. TaxID=2575872 RepID=UPI003BAB57BB